MESIFFAFVAFFGWGVGDLFTTITSRKLNAYSATFWNFLLGTILLSLFIPFQLTNLGNLTLPNFILNIVLGGVLLLGIICFRDALIKGSSPVIVAISASYAVVTTILSLIFFKESLTLAQGLCVLLVFVGLFLAVFDLSKLSSGKLHFGKGGVLALLAALFWGIYFAFIKIPVQETGWFWPNYFSFVFFIPVIFFWIRFKKIELTPLNHNGALLPVLVGLIIIRLSDLAFNAGIEKGSSSIVATIAGANPVLFLILASIFLKDPVTKQQFTGIVVTLGGVILLSFLSI